MDGLLSWVIPYKYEQDDRVPIFSFNVAGDEYGFYMLSVIYWIELLTIIAIMCLVSTVIGVVTFKLIVQRQGTPLAYLVGFGVIIPFWVTTPYYGLEIFDVRNKFMKFCCGGILPTLGIFRTVAGM